MSMPGFSAEASLHGPNTDYRAMAEERQIYAGFVTPQFCYCECQLRRICLPIGGVWRCFWVKYCTPHGNCPPGYCQSGF